MKHRVLVIGTGSIGERHVRCMLATDRAEIGICEIQEQLRATIADRYSLVGAYASLAEAMQERWDAAVIATPSPSHISILSELVDIGMSVLVEKPLSMTMDGVPKLIEKVKSRKLTAVVGYVWRANPALAAMRKFLLSGQLGKPVQIVAVSGQNFPYHRPAYRTIYYADRTKGGGAIQDMLPHLLNAGEWLVGPIDCLVADATHMILEGVEVEDTVHVLTRHGHVMGCYSLNQHQAPNETTISVMCERGTLRFELHNHLWRWMGEPDDPWHDEESGLQSRDDWFVLQANAFFDALEGKAKPLCTLEEGLQTLKANVAVLASVDGRKSWQVIT